MLVGIVAVARNFAIGKKGKLPWHYPADLMFFKETTSGSAVVMGFHTWQSIGKPLPKRLNIVLSRSAALVNRAGVLLLRSKAEVRSLADYLKGDVFVIGGATVYKEFADAIEKWLVTEIPETIEDADTFMPEDFLDGFAEQGSIELGSDLRVKIFVRSVKP
ncbi:MAG TPA: dihydrofolate reductase [Pyrinomonadaceae bacterium]|jgi:dihydrofolate reductase